MDELEFCLKSLSYPLGMLLERLERRNGKVVTVSKETLTLPEIPFVVKCYLTAVALFESLDIVDKKRLSDDYKAIEEFRLKILHSKLGEGVAEYLTDPGRYLLISEHLAIDWLEFERREEKVRPYLERLKELRNEVKERSEFLKRTDFLEELGVDEGLLLRYLAEDEKFKELINAALGKHNPEFKAMVVRYFKALRG
ncbi:hypothetical protein E3E26_09250 [Thermococcus sp. LS1]|uniref:hypothetical protein n=1 Tax=Thermococcus sp. LS1 TaxID=1638259 RepID=UPI001439275F|nr:hypothetical protein [Thermococcus sp. LS1]NJD99962.1 hypothetical protein [Thermococcus sp. LS1]